jgi:threonine/homoserine/homoserine lactone efflux protein
MAPALYAAFVLAVVTLMLIPGPNVALIVANSIARGPRAGLATVAGTSAAMVPQLALTGLGMSALLAGLAEAFFYLRWLGVAYLIFLAYRSWTAPADDLAAAPASRQPTRALFLRGFFVSLSNPKTLLFFAAFFPQFLDPKAPLGPQIWLLSASFLALAVLVDSFWALAAARVGGALRIGGRLRNRLTGGFLFGAGLGLALVRRS